AGTPAPAPAPAAEPAPAPGEEGKPAGDQDGKTEEEKAAEEAKAKVEKEINDEADALNLKDKTRERFTEILRSNKEQAAELESVRSEMASARETLQANDELMSSLIDSTITGPQLAGMLNVAKLMNSEDRNDRAIAFDGLMEELKKMAVDLGREIPGFADPLEPYPDLQQKVESGDMLREDAIEHARLRREGESRQQQDQQRNESQQYEDARVQALTDLQSLYSELGTNNANWQQQVQMLTPAIDIIVGSMHPSQWVGAIRDAYRKLPPIAATPAPAPAPAAQGAKPPVATSPLRPSTATAATMQQEFKPEEDGKAFHFGVQQASKG
ncbi:MAG TPA: hypothetical protein VKA50_07365, partial [Gammaproteobacteria bacterium]|nr:hypothetical protein [Gammaproteobacteria bacterium]